MFVKCKYQELVDPTSLIPNPRNPNKHSEKQIKLLAKLLKHQGWRHPIIVSNRSGFVVAGHGRLEAALKEGFERVPIDRQDFESEAEEYQFMVSDNTIQELAELDLSMVNQDVLDFGPEFDLEMLAIPDFKIDLNENDIEIKEKELDENIMTDKECPSCGYKW